MHLTIMNVMAGEDEFKMAFTLFPEVPYV